MNPWLNPTLVEYLVENSKYYSRYELDLVLLKQGFSGPEIEAAWTAFSYSAPRVRQSYKKLYFVGFTISLIGYISLIFLDSVIIPVIDYLSNSQTHKLNIGLIIDWEIVPNNKVITNIGIINFLILTATFITLIWLFAKFPVIVSCFQALTAGFFMCLFSLEFGDDSADRKYIIPIVIHILISLLILTLGGIPALINEIINGNTNKGKLH